MLKVLFEERGITAIGHESMDTDTTKIMEGETYVLGHGHWQIEVMDNLDKVPATGALVVASWPKPKAGLGFPGPGCSPSCRDGDVCEHRLRGRLRDRLDHGGGRR